MAMYLPRGLWGLVGDRFDLRLFPVGYWVHGGQGRPPGHSTEETT